MAACRASAESASCNSSIKGLLGGRTGCMESSVRLPEASYVMTLDGRIRALPVARDYSCEESISHGNQWTSIAPMYDGIGAAGISPDAKGRPHAAIGSVVPLEPLPNALVREYDVSYPLSESGLILGVRRL